MATKVPSKNSLCFKLLYLKNKLGDPHFLSLKSDQQAKMKLRAKFQKMLWSGFRAAIKFPDCEGGHETLQRILS